MPNGQGYFFQQNRLGSVTHLTNFVGNPIERYRYDAFGTPTTLDPILGYFNNRFRFTGREYQEAFGIYEYRNRVYHPGLGRFLSEDPLGFGAGDSNMFRYCGGDPVNWTDPAGLTTVQIGLTVGFNWWILAGSWTSGIAFDGNGNIGTFNTPFGGGGIGARGSGGISVAVSNADTINGLAGTFNNANVAAGLGHSGTGQAFWGKDPTNGKTVIGGGFAYGPGLGGGFSLGRSDTIINHLWSPSSDSRAIGGSSGTNPLNWAGTLASGSSWAWFPAPAGATSWGTSNPQGTLATLVPTFWGPANGNASNGAGSVPDADGDLTGSDPNSSGPGSTAGFFDPLFGDSPPRIAPGPEGLASGGFGTAFPYARMR